MESLTVFYYFNSMAGLERDAGTAANVQLASHLFGLCALILS